jgi:tRNA dimethylallyltransferase
MDKLLIICGATASGKSSLAIELAKTLNTDVISADSQLVYKGLNVGTAKPTIEEMQGVRHHLIDVIEPTQTFNVGDYEERALPIVKELFANKKTPIVCGGTGFYINSILYDLSYGNVVANPDIRKKYDEILKERGNEYVHSLLKKVDEESANKLHPNETQRVIRALEIFETTGKKKSEQGDSYNPRFDYLAVAINHPREVLYDRIDKRVDIMFENGLVDEVKGLLASGIDKNMQCMKAIGYKEVVECLEKGYGEEQMREAIKLNTRHYAKRQITFFKRIPNLVWIDPEKTNSVLELFNK